MEPLKITNAIIVSPDKQANVSGGLYVNFASKKNLAIGQTVKVLFKDTLSYFEVSDISINGDNIEAKAIEVGYWATKLGRNTNFDIREIIGSNVEIITDQTLLSEIREMSLWC